MSLKYANPKENLTNCGTAQLIPLFQIGPWVRSFMRMKNTIRLCLNMGEVNGGPPGLLYSAATTLIPALISMLCLRLNKCRCLFNICSSTQLSSYNMLSISAVGKSVNLMRCNNIILYCKLLVLRPIGCEFLELYKKVNNMRILCSIHNTIN